MIFSVVKKEVPFERKMASEYPLAFLHDQLSTLVSGSNSTKTSGCSVEVVSSFWQAAKTKHNTSKSIKVKRILFFTINFRLIRLI